MRRRELRPGRARTWLSVTLACLVSTAVGYLVAKAGCAGERDAARAAARTAGAPGPRDTVVPPRPTGVAGVPVADLRTRGVVGDLGWPLGSLMTVEGAMVSDTDRRMKGDMGKTLARIDRAGGAALAKARIFDLRGAKTLASLKPGTRVRFIGYETGGFRGAPSGLFKYVPAFTTTGYAFETWLEVVKVQP